LDEVLDYLARDSPAAARQILRDALTAAASLATLPERGRVVPEFGLPQVRELFVHRYRLIYRVGVREIEILAFIHGARDFGRWIRESGT
jgi:plasmid stabilization system protein ParE